MPLTRSKIRRMWIARERRKRATLRASKISIRSGVRGYDEVTVVSGPMEGRTVRVSRYPLEAAYFDVEDAERTG